VSPSASPQDGQQSQSSSRTGKATIRQVDTTVGGATETGADLIVGQIVPAPTGFAGENFVQDGCSGSTSNNPILVTNNTSTTQSFGYNAQSQLQSSGSLLMLSTPPYLESGATETNMCTLLYQQGWVINTGDEMTVEPGMTGVVYALMGGGAQTGGEAAWLVMGGTGAGWYQFELQLKSPTQGFDFLEMPGNDGSQGAMGNWIENGPVGANLVACGTNPGGGAYPDESSIIVNGDVPGDWASPGQNYNSGEGPEYTFNQPICFAAPDGT
jgi:YD repeat-containing protein